MLKLKMVLRRKRPLHCLHRISRRCVLLLAFPPVLFLKCQLLMSEASLLMLKCAPLPCKVSVL